MLKAVLFDLDGTLLPLDMDKFLDLYFELMAEKLEPYGYDRDELIKTIWKCTKKMIANDGSKDNYTVFWQGFAEAYGKKALDHIPVFDDYYLNEFKNVKSVCGSNPKANETVKFLRENNVRVTLATNPFFPRVGTLERMRWAGLDASDFEIITTYENINYCKPNVKYFEEILRRMDLDTGDCIMVGNDVDDDIVPAKKLGMRAFLLTDCMLNKNNVDISGTAHGDFTALRTYLENCMEDNK